MRMIHSMGHVFGGTLLIAGTTIGVGMLALPVVTGPGGFLPSIIIYLICWVFMLCTGFLLLEICLWMPKNTSFISMAEQILGPIGRYIFWVIYLFLFLTVMIAHAVGGGSILIDITELNIPNWLAIFIYSTALAPIVYMGAKTVDRLNIFLISGVVITYLSFIVILTNKLNPDFLRYTNWTKAWAALPVLFTAFTYQLIIPTLMTYMERNIKKIRMAIVIGSLIPLIVYLIWQFAILGIIPTQDLVDAGKHGQNIITPLKKIIPEVFNVGRFFAFFALTTSFIPLALSFFDFMADGLKWEKKGIKRAVLSAGIFGFPMLIAIAYPNIFLISLGYAGGVSCAILFGLMPPLLVWVGRYIKCYPEQCYQLPGGRPVLVFLMLFAILILAGEIVQQIV